MSQQISAQTLRFKVQKARIKADHLMCLLAELRLQFKDERTRLFLSEDVIKAVIIKPFAHLERPSMKINLGRQKFRRRNKKLLSGSIITPVLLKLEPFKSVES